MKYFPRKTSNKRRRRLLQHGPRNPGVYNRDPAFIGDLASAFIKHWPRAPVFINVIACLC